MNSLYYPDEPGGAEKFVRILANGLADRGLEVSVICLTQGGPAEELVNRVQVRRLTLANLYWPFDAEERSGFWRMAWHAIDSINPVMALKFGKLLDELKPDAVHLHNVAGFSAEVIQAAQRRSIPIVQTLHDYYYACPRTTGFSDGRNCRTQCTSCRALTWVRRRRLRTVDEVCGVSSAVLKRVESLGARLPERASVIYNPNPEAPGRIRPRSRTDRVRLGFIGRLGPAKGLETIIDAMTRLSSPRYTLEIAGRGPPQYLDLLKARAQGLPITFRGFVEAMNFIGEMDFLIVPSVWEEPFGRVAQEALLLGVPPIVARSGGIPEALGALIDDLSFAPGDVDDLAATIVRLTDQGPAAFEARCRDQSARFELTGIIDEHLTLYRSVLRRRRGKRAARGAE